MLDCPKCGIAAYDGTSCGACRFSPDSKISGKPPPDPMHLICEHVAQGQRCAELGTFSQGTYGGGPWYCYRHFPLFSGRYEGKPPTEPPQGFKALKDCLRLVPKDPEALAERAAIETENRFTG
jgi:hypothetical protein